MAARLIRYSILSNAFVLRLQQLDFTYVYMSSANSGEKLVNACSRITMECSSILNATKTIEMQ